MTSFCWRTILFAAFATIVAGAANAQSPIIIGAHGGLTGPGASDGHSCEIAIRLALEEANAAGGINGRNLKLVIYDDNFKADEAVPIANKLVGDDKVVAAISCGFSLPSKTAAPVFQDAHIPYIVAYATHPDITKTGDYVFRTGILADVEGRAGAKLVGDILKKKRVVLVTVKADLGKANADGFKEAAPKFGIEIVKQYEYTPADRQFGPMIASIKSDNPDLLYVSGFFFTGAPLLRQLRESGVNAPFVGTNSFASSKFFEIAGPAAEGAMITDVINWSTKDPTDLKFYADFEKRAGLRPEVPGAMGYAVAQLLIAAIRASGDADPKKIRDRLAETNMRTVVGQITFNKRREVRRSFMINVGKDGHWETSGVVEDPVLLAPPED